MPFDSSDDPPAARAREQVAKILEHALEEEVALSATMREFLTRLTGPNFHSLFRLFGDQRRQIDRWMSEISERVRAFGAGQAARASPEDRAYGANATEAVAAAVPASTLVGELLALHERIAARLRDDVARCEGDASTASLLTKLVEFHDTTAWMLRMVLEGPEVPERPA